jgi:uncharacterized membrane protein
MTNTNETNATCQSNDDGLFGVVIVVVVIALVVVVVVVVVVVEYTNVSPSRCSSGMRSIRQRY